MILISQFFGFLLIFCYSVKSEDVFATINTKRSVNFVDDKFISVCVDPMILLSELNIGEPTLALAKNLYPALIRFQGPSTPSFMFSLSGPKEDRLAVTPPMWVGLNKWLKEAGLIPVFALSDVDRINDQWDARMVLPLMELSDRMGLECYWEIDNYYPNKTTKQVVSDIEALNHIQEAFPGLRNKWYTIAGDMSKSNFSFEKLKKLIQMMNGKVKAMNWNPETTNNHDILTKYVMTSKPKIPIWTNAPRFPDPTSFTNGLMWAKYLGDSAKQGYSIVYRQPKIRELFEFTPSFLISVLHKQLMGRNVLEMRSSNIMNFDSKTYMYAHCAKRQNSYTHKGAIAIFMINMQENPVNGSVRFIGSPVKNVEVQSYILTAPDENTSTVLCNGELIDETFSNKLQFTPVSTMAHVGKFLTLSLPPRSVGFFVIPNALSTLCMHEEEMDIYKDEIKADQQKEMSKDYDDHQKALDTLKNIANVNDLYKLLEQELSSNENWYHETVKRKEWKELLVQRLKEQKEKIENSSNKFEKGTKELLSKISDIENKLEATTTSGNEEITADNADENLTMRPAETANILETNEDLKKILNNPNLALPVPQIETARYARDIKESKFLKSLKASNSVDASKELSKEGSLMSGENLLSKDSESYPVEVVEIDADKSLSYSAEEKKFGELLYCNEEIEKNENIVPVKIKALKTELFEIEGSDENSDNSSKRYKRETKNEIDNENKKLADPKEAGSKIADPEPKTTHVEPKSAHPEGKPTHPEPKPVSEQKSAHVESTPGGGHLEDKPEPKTAQLEPKLGQPQTKPGQLGGKNILRRPLLNRKNILKVQPKKIMENARSARVGERKKLNMQPKKIMENRNTRQEERKKLFAKHSQRVESHKQRMEGVKKKLEDRRKNVGSPKNRLEEHRVMIQNHNKEIQQKVGEFMKARQAKNVDRSKRFALEIPEEPQNNSDNIQISYQYLIKKEKNNEIVKTTESTIDDMTCPANFTGDNPIFKEPIVLVIGKPSDISQILHDEQEREAKLAQLKKKLAFQKMIEEKKKAYLQKLKGEESLARLITLRKRRSILPIIWNDAKINEIPKASGFSDEDIWYNDITKDGKIDINVKTESEEEPYKIVIPSWNELRFGNGLGKASRTSTSTAESTTESTTTDISTESTTTTTDSHLDSLMDEVFIVEPKEEVSPEILAIPQYGFKNDVYESMAKLFSNLQDKFVNYTVYLFGGKPSQS